MSCADCEALSRQLRTSQVGEEFCASVARGLYKQLAEERMKTKRREWGYATLLGLALFAGIGLGGAIAIETAALRDEAVLEADSAISHAEAAEALARGCLEAQLGDVELKRKLREGKH